MADALVDAPSWDIAERIDRLMIEMFRRVSNTITGATLALLSDDRDAAMSILEEDDRVDALADAITSAVTQNLARGAGSTDRAAYLMMVVRMLPDIERGDVLSGHIARQAHHGHASQMSAHARGLIEQMGETAAQMWNLAADAFGDHSAEASLQLDDFDDELDSLCHTLLDDLVQATTAPSIIIELTLVARYYERLGDHAANLARRTSERLRRVRLPGEPA